jgi:site-specific DNA-methyltransferase (adenine-specific)
MNMETLTTTAVPVGELLTYHRNPRRGNIPVIAESLEVLGQYKPIVVNAGTHTGRPNEVLAGNHTLLAARQLGWESVQVVHVDVDEETAARIVAVDNRSSDLATNDDELLAELLASLPDLTATGYSSEDLDALLASVDTSVPIKGDPDDAPDLPIEPVTEPGQMWELGPHRLLCADATDADAVAAFMDGDLADCMWTDPPYGVSYVGKTKDALTIRNDGAENLEALLDAAFAAADQVLRPGAPVYVAHPPGPLSLDFARAFLNAAWSLRQNLIWVKDQMVLGRSDYHYRHEPVLYGFTAGGEGRLGRGGDRWYGDNAQTSVFEVPRPSRSEVHPTMKPVDLITAHLNNSCRPGGLVYEPFGGSGSTLIAAHMTRRAARVVELDPAYADVICRRWQEATGHAPLRDGVEHDFTQGG